MKTFAAVSSILALGTLGIIITNLLAAPQDLHLSFSEEDIYSEL